MIRISDEMKREVKEQFRGGKGSVTFKEIFSKDEMTGKSRLCSTITLSPGSSIGLHEHVDEEEIYYVISGKGIVTDNGITREVSEGDAILTVGGTSHAVENTGNEPLEMLAVILLYS